jgi:acetylornithine deacetylase/succinyl-diaminopimelate desuccinylase-like protein
MSREAAIAAAEAYFDDGGFAADLARRVAIPTESQVEERAAVLGAYLNDEIAPTLGRLGFKSEIFANPVRGGPILIAERREKGAATTVLGYGHGDVIRGLEPQWRDGLSPWELTRQGDRLYGRGTADNKGQHSINLAALETVLKTRGRLGFNAILLLETGEEIGSPGLREICRAQKGRLAADVLIASDGPRLAPERPTIFLGARGAMNFDLVVDLREGGHHSGNWGGLLARASSWRMRWPRSATTRARSRSRSGSRATCRTRCAWRWPTARLKAARTHPRSTPTGASRA